MSELKERNQINEIYKWRLEDIFENDGAWETAFDRALECAERFLTLRGELGKSAEGLLAALSLSDELDGLLLSVNAYAAMRRDEDNECAKYRAMADRASDLASDCAAKCAFFSPELIALGREKIESFMSQCEPLSVYRQFFDDMFRGAEHTLDAAGERLLSLSGPACEAPSDIFAAMNNADIKFGTIVGEDGAETELTQSRYGIFLESADRGVRQNAYSALYKQYRAYKNLFAATFAGNVKSDLFHARARGFESTIDMRLSENCIDKSVYDGLLNVVGEGLSELSDYLELRRRALGLERLCMYDLYTPLVGEDKEKIPYEQACELVLSAVAPLGEQYVKDMRRAFSERWVDVYENRGKTPGAYSWGDNKTHPFVLMNYQGGIDDVFTLAHEMGHAMHSYYTNAAQPPVYRDYKIFVAEVASTVNEGLLLKYLLKTASSEKRRAALLCRELEGIRTTFYRQAMFAEFERDVHAAYMDGTALTAESLCDIYGGINKKYYGSAAVCDENISYEWARIPHFYTSFYVYQYATGYAAASRINELVLSSGGAAEKYMRFLRGGSSKYPLQLLSDAGVDLRSRETVFSVVREFARATQELSAILDK